MTDCFSFIILKSVSLKNIFVDVKSVTFDKDTIVLGPGRSGNTSYSYTPDIADSTGAYYYSLDTTICTIDSITGIITIKENADEGNMARIVIVGVLLLKKLRLRLLSQKNIILILRKTQFC